MRERLDQAVLKGGDGVDPNNYNAYYNNGGGPWSQFCHRKCQAPL